MINETSKMKKILFIVGTLFFTSVIAQTKIQMIKEGGVYSVPCKINGLPLKFVFDTGASDVSISLTEASFMLKNGFISKEDIGGGLSLRFPRLVEWNRDKSVNEATTVKELTEMFNMRH